MDENSQKMLQSAGCHASRMAKICKATQKMAAYLIGAYFYFLAACLVLVFAPLQILMFFSEPEPDSQTDPLGSFRHLVLAALCIAIAAVMLYAMRTNAKARRACR